MGFDFITIAPSDCLMVSSLFLDLLCYVSVFFFFCQWLFSS